VRQIQSMANVEVYLQNAMRADHVLEVRADHVAVATGARWRRDGVARFNDTIPSKSGPEQQIFTPDDVMTGRLPEGPDVVFDNDFYYMGSVIAERLHAEGLPVTVVTAESKVCAWGENTGEQTRSHKRLLDLGVNIVTGHGLMGLDGNEACLCCIYTGRIHSIQARGVVTITARIPRDALYHELMDRIDEGRVAEEEIMGEAYFYGLAGHFLEFEKLSLLASVERRVAQAIDPLLEKCGLIPRTESELKVLGEGYVERHKSYT